MSPNPASILDSVKKGIGLDSADTTFDLDVTMFINSAFGPLQQVGVGPESGFLITDNSTLWSAYITRSDVLGMVKIYITMSVRLAFDPPATSFGIEAVQKQLDMLLWRINVMVETALASPSHWWDVTGLYDFPSDALIGDFGFDSSDDKIYFNTTSTNDGYWWDLTGLSDFPAEALVGEYGYSSTTGQVWRKTA